MKKNYGMWHHIFNYFEQLNIILSEHFESGKSAKSTKVSISIYIFVIKKNIVLFPFGVNTLQWTKKTSKIFLNMITYLLLKACIILQSFSGKKLKWLSPTIFRRKIRIKYLVFNTKPYNFTHRLVSNSPVDNSWYGRLQFIRSVLGAPNSPCVWNSFKLLFCGFITQSFFALHCFGTFWHTFSSFQPLSLAKDHWRGFSTRNAHMVHIVN